MDLSEGRPARVVDVAALDEEVEDLTRTDARLRQSQSGRAAAAGVEFNVLAEQLRVRDAVVRSTTSETQDLPQSHSERPDVTS